MSLLEIDGLTHSFGENVLYKNAGFTLNKGEHIGIVGQNGTGKSTLIKICTEQIIPDSGTHCLAAEYYDWLFRPICGNRPYLNDERISQIRFHKVI